MSDLKQTLIRIITGDEVLSVKDLQKMLDGLMVTNGKEYTSIELPDVPNEPCIFRQGKQKAQWKSERTFYKRK